MLEDYANELSDLPVEALMLAAKAILNEDKEWYQFPSIGAVRARATTLTAPRYPLPAEAWDAVMSGTADKASLPACVFRQLHFDRSDIGRMSPGDAGNCQARFLAAYREAVTRAQTEAKLPQAIRDALPAPSVQPQLESPGPGERRAKQKAEEEAAYAKWFRQRAERLQNPSAADEPLPNDFYPHPPQGPVQRQPCKEIYLEAHQRKLKAQAAAGKPGGGSLLSMAMPALRPSCSL